MPVFNVPIAAAQPEWPPPPSPSSSTSSAASPSRQPAAAYVGALSQLHQSLVVLPTVLCGPSRPSSPSFQERTKKLQSRIQHCAINSQSTVDLKRLWSSRITYKGARAVLTTGAEIIPGDGEVPDVLPDTEEEWFAWEALVNERRARKQVVPPAKLQITRDKVDSWRAAVPAEMDPPRNTTASQESGKSSKLNFRVVKRAPTLKAKSAFIKGLSQIPESQNRELRPGTSSDSRRKSGDPELVPAEIVPDSQVEAEESQASKKVTDLPDESEFPAPSFPAQLIASTPKYVTIAANADIVNPASANTLSLSVGKVTAAAAVKEPAVQDSHVAATSSSCNAPRLGSRSPVVSDPRDDHTYPHLKNGNASHTPELPGAGIELPSRPVTPTNVILTVAEDTSLRSPSSRNNHKRARAASPSSLVPRTPSPLSAKPSLGNADCLPLSTTPGKSFPEIPDLLATSRSSRVRPRPPSRKKVRDADGETRKTPSVYMTDEDAEDTFSDVSPSKSYFSSPASGSSDSSPGATRQILSSPISPTAPRFTPNPHKFAPIAASTQVLHDELFDDDEQVDAKQPPARGLERASSGLLGMAYCSQFDVNAHMDQLNEFIDRDVDFGAWIKDIEPEDEEEVASQL